LNIPVPKNTKADVTNETANKIPPVPKKLAAKDLNAAPVPPALFFNTLKLETN
jgi:hypothetical protein